MDRQHRSGEQVLCGGSERAAEHQGKWPTDDRASRRLPPTPVISVDTKKKELVGDFKNGGQKWQAKGQSEEVRSHDFEDTELGKAVPYGVYDIGTNQGWLSVGIDHDTAQFAVQSIGSWWRRMGQEACPGATELLITADAVGSDGSRTRLWKRELQRLADAAGLTITICHLPPGTSKWNKIEDCIDSEQRAGIGLGDHGQEVVRRGF